MKIRKKKEAVCALFLAAAVFLGSLPLTGFTVKAEEGQKEAQGEENVTQTSPSRFQHPGLLHSQEALDRAWENVQNNVSPNKETWDALWWDTFSNPNYNAWPMEEVTRGIPGANIGKFCGDLKRAYQNALIWKLSGDEAHGAAACRIVNAYSATLKRVGGSQDRFLVSGLQGYQLANIGELLRGHPDFHLEELQNLLLNAFYPLNQDFLIRHNDTYVGSYWTNWEIANIASMISIGVFCDREDIYEEALRFFKYGKGNGSFYHAMPYVLEQDGNELVQWQESIRDQGHTTLGILLGGVICETAWNQGDDLYGLSDNRFMKAAEYAIKCNNLGEQEVPSTWYMRVSGNLKAKPKLEYYAGVNRWPAGSWRPIYYQMYNHYVNRKGVEMPFAKQMIQNANGTYMEGSPGNVTDQLGWYSLTYANTGERVEDKPIQGELTDGVYRIVSALSGKSLVTNDDGELVTAPKGSKKEEWWLVKNCGDGEYTITSLGGEAVQINGEGTQVRNVNGTDYTYSRYYLEGSAVGTGKADGSRKQRFAFLKDEDGLYRIVPSMNYYVWSLKDNNVGDNVKIHQWFNDASGPYNNDSSPAQRWIFEKATEMGTEFTFDDESSGFSTVYAEAEGSHGLWEHGTGKAVSFNGTDQFLTVAAKTGKSVLAGETAFTVTCEVKPEPGNSGFLFYASPGAAQPAGSETYLGIKEENGTVTAVSCKDGKESASVSAEGKTGWYQLSVVYDGAEIILYINGQEKGRKSGTYKVSDIITEDSIVQIGKAELQNGQFYKGQIDNLKIMGHVMTEGELIQSAGDYASGEIIMPEVLADFTFDDAQTGFSGGAAKAKGVYSMAEHDGGKALYLNGYKDYLKVTGQNGGSVVPGGLVKEMTVSLQVKRDGGDFGWVFYAAPDDSSPTIGWEKYLGIADFGSTVKAERYYNEGQRLASAEAETKEGRWHYLTIVYTEESILIYEDGVKKAETANRASLTDILGSDSIWYIGKANWRKSFNREKGEHFRGWIDNVKILSRAWTEEEVKAEALKYVDKSLLKKSVDSQSAEKEEIYTAERWQTYQTALENAETVLADENALQISVDNAEEPLSRVQAWMRMDEALHGAVGEEHEAMYTAKTWKPYEEALSEARELNGNNEASNAELEQAAQNLCSAQKALLKKTGTIFKAINRIKNIGIIEQTPECSGKIILARQTCSLLTEEELERVTNLHVLEEAEAAMGDYLAEFTFDDEQDGFIGGQAVANVRKTPEIRDGALYLDGTGNNWLSITKADGSSLLTGRTELTCSFAVKPEPEKGNWLFYAAANDNAQELEEERYLGLLEFQGAISAERFKNNGPRPETAFVEGVDTSKWMHVTLVHTANETIIYINGEEKARKSSDIALPDIFGENSILQIGKANWGNGEYYKGFLDNVKILGTALTAEEIRKEADAYLESVAWKNRVDDANAKIKAIGKVDASKKTQERIKQARSAYNLLSDEEKKLIVNAKELFEAESLYQKLAEEAKKKLAEFTFDDAENGFASSDAVAQPSGTPVIVQDAERGKVLSLDGAGSVWLNVAKKDGTPLLTGAEELTISYYSKSEREAANWIFYAAPHGNPQTFGQERYIGILENTGKATAERFLNGRQESAEAACEAGWKHVVVVYGFYDTKVYVNGILKKTAENNGSLQEILGEQSVLQIGKANWGDGEYCQGLLDDFAIYNHAFSERQVQIMDGVIANPEKIKDKVREAEAIQKGNYTDESYDVLQEAIVKANAAYETVTTKKEVEAAVAALQAAIDGLEEKTVPEPLDTKALSDKILEAKAIQKGNYTEESYDALQKAIAAAEEALAKVKTPEEVTSEAGKLQDAIGNLRINSGALAVKVGELKISPEKRKLTVGEAFDIQVTVSPDNATNPAYEVSSSDSGVAEVTGTKVIAKKPGKAVITAAAADGSGEKAFAVVEVCQKMTAKVQAAQLKTSRSVKVTFANVNGAAGYDVYRSTSPGKGYKKIASTGKTSFVDKTVKPAKTYYYKIVVKAREAEYNSGLSVKYAKIKVLERPAIKVKALKGRKAGVSWKKVKGAKGYVVYISAKKTKGFKAVKTLKKGKAVKAVVKAKKSVKKLYIKVRPYHTVKGKRIYGPYSKTKSVTIKN